MSFIWFKDFFLVYSFIRQKSIKIQGDNNWNGEDSNLLNVVVIILDTDARSVVLLKFETDRKNYTDRLRETSKKYSISVLDYMVTSNHVHLLVFSSDTDTLSRAMQFIQGTTAKDFNRRKTQKYQQENEKEIFSVKEDSPSYGFKLSSRKGAQHIK